MGRRPEPRSSPRPNSSNNAKPKRKPGAAPFSPANPAAAAADPLPRGRATAALPDQIPNTHRRRPTFTPKNRISQLFAHRIPAAPCYRFCYSFARMSTKLKTLSPIDEIAFAELLDLCRDDGRHTYHANGSFFLQNRNAREDFSAG